MERPVWFLLIMAGTLAACSRDTPATNRMRELDAYLEAQKAQRFREKLPGESEGSYAEARSHHSVLTTITQSGHPCVAVAEVHAVLGGSGVEVTCVKYRDGTGRVHYLVNEAGVTPI